MSDAAIDRVMSICRSRKLSTVYPGQKNAGLRRQYRSAMTADRAAPWAFAKVARMVDSRLCDGRRIGSPLKSSVVNRMIARGLYTVEADRMIDGLLVQGEDFIWLSIKKTDR